MTHISISTPFPSPRPGLVDCDGNANAHCSASFRSHFRFLSEAAIEMILCTHMRLSANPHRESPMSMYLAHSGTFASGRDELSTTRKSPMSAHPYPTFLTAKNTIKNAMAM